MCAACEKALLGLKTRRSVSTELISGAELEERPGAVAPLLCVTPFDELPEDLTVLEEDFF
jgi:hypothetical protein